MANRMVRRIITAKTFVTYPLERGGFGLFNVESGYQVATFATAPSAEAAGRALMMATHHNETAP